MPSATSSGASAPAPRSRPGATKRMSPAHPGSTTIAIGSSVSGHGSKSGAPSPPATRRLPAASWAYSAWPPPWTGSSSRTEPRDSQALIPTRLNLDLLQVGVAGEALEALCGERVPGLAERIDDGVVGVEQAMAEMPLTQVQPDPLHRVELGRVGRQPDERDVARDGEPLGPVPAGAVEHQDGVLACDQRRRELGEEAVHGRGRDLRQDEREGLARGRPDGGEEGGPGIALVAQARRPPAAGEPAMADAPLLAKSGLVHEPGRQARVGMRRPPAVEGGPQPPLANASRAAASAFGCEGRAFRRDRPRRRIGLPMCEGW